VHRVTPIAVTELRKVSRESAVMAATATLGRDRRAVAFEVFDLPETALTLRAE
jgi:hypothetical protein